MVDLHANERLIINQLFDRGIFTSTITPEMTNNTVNAIAALKQPLVQRRITNYLTDLLGMGPYNYQENLLLLVGEQQLTAEEVHVLLATLKAVINEPSIQADEDGRIVSAQTIIRQVRSEVVDLDEKRIFRLIKRLFVERFKLFTPEQLEQAPGDQAILVEEYWSVSPDFTSVAQCLVNNLRTAQQRTPLTEIQQVNRGLLRRRFLSPKVTPYLWTVLVENKVKIAEKWAQLQRFELEIGDDYALLLDRQRQRSAAKPYIIALAVARSLGAGLPQEQLNQRVHQIVERLYGAPQNVSITLVKEALFENALASKHGQNILPTPLVKRFAVRATEEEKI
ncbi:hypothetical protein [Loigolactobacillus jiayinensis]|uniref:Uncharacterized protein n=1 Tax=Loigolactobacillus jiayinensis TaxID=2486016 RepID=A0ABW1R9P6_9LACO|nr:hypothetical protein [Loigolactobacillus jiayinensis]